MAKRTEHLSQKEAAKRLGISATMLRKFGARISRNDDGSYPWPKIRDEHAELVAASEERKDEGYGNASYQEGRAQLVRANAAAAELKLRIARGEVLEQADVEPLLRRSAERMNATLLQAPDKFSDVLAKKAGLSKRDARKILVDIIELVRAELRGAPGAAA